jgi:hypothetical protein
VVRETERAQVPGVYRELREKNGCLDGGDAQRPHVDAEPRLAEPVVPLRGFAAFPFAEAHLAGVLACRGVGLELGTNGSHQQLMTAAINMSRCRRLIPATVLAGEIPLRFSIAATFLGPRRGADIPVSAWEFARELNLDHALERDYAV